MLKVKKEKNLKKYILISSLIILFLFLYSFLTLIKKPVYPTKEKFGEINLKIELNKSTFYPGENVKFNAIIFSTENLENVTSMFYGIKTRANLLWFKIVDSVKLKKGENIFSYNFSLPTCYSCEGLKKGKYSITGLVILKDKIINSTKQIELVE